MPSNAPSQLAPETRLRYDELQRMRAKHEMFRLMAAELGYDAQFSDLNNVCRMRLEMIDCEIISLLRPHETSAPAAEHLTVEAVARLLGVSARTVMRIEASPKRMQELGYPGRDIGYQVFMNWATPLRNARMLNKAVRERKKAQT